MAKHIGFSTGAFFPFLNPASKEALRLALRAREQDTVAPVELSLLKIKKVEPHTVDELVRLVDVPHTSIHAPTDVSYGYNRQTRQVFSMLERFKKVERFIFHPDTVDNFEVFNDLLIPYHLENSDSRKGYGRTVEDMKQVLSLTAFDEYNPNIVLDLAHCCMIDPNMKLARDFIQAFHGRIAEVHISGEKDGHHVPLLECSYEMREKIFSALATIDDSVPVIIESPCMNPAFAMQELELVKKNS